MYLPDVTRSASIVICTKDRAISLAPTLESLRRSLAYQRWMLEVLVVDNGSVDATESVVSHYAQREPAIRHVCEPRAGLSHARNRGLQEAQGEVIIFTDDDVRVCPHWIEAMCGPIIKGDADAVAGAVQIAPHLERCWLKGELRGWVGATGGNVNLDRPGCVVGANFAIARQILKQVPCFDTELGAGALGFYEEALFWKQMLVAGARIIGRSDISVEHHFSEDRLNTAGFEIIAQRLGRSLAYVHHHWEHGSVKIPRLRWAFWKAMQKIRGRHSARSDDAPDPAHLFRIFHLAFLDQFLIERARPRNYERHGLLKLRGMTDLGAAGTPILHPELQSQ